MHAFRTTLCACLVHVVFLLVNALHAAEAAEGPPFPRIANVYGVALTPDGARVSGETHSLEEVARCDLLIGVRGAKESDEFQKQLAALKELNPNLIALHFACSAPYTHVAPDKEKLAARQTGQPLPWLLQTDGSPIAGWPGTYMLNLPVPGVVEWLAHQSVPAVRQRGYDGVFIDCMGPHFDHWACEIATGRDYTVDSDADGQDDDREVLKEAWTRAKTDLARRTRGLIGDEAVFLANQAGPSTYDQLNGIYLEDYVDAILDSRLDWDSVLEKYLHWTQTPQRPNVTVLGCSSGVEPPFEPYKLSAEKQASYLRRGKPELARMRFGLAATLMGDGYYSFDLNTRWRGQLWWYPEYDAPLGYPTGPCMRQADGTWRRPYDGGWVIVNPSSWDVSVELDRVHRDASSGRVDSRFVLPRRDGRIYLPSDESAAPGDWPEPEPLLTADGPAGVVGRQDALVVRDGDGLAILVNGFGEVESLSHNGIELIVGVRPVIVQDQRWRNFAFAEVQHEVNSSGELVFTGRRTDQGQAIGFRQTIRVDHGRLTIEYRWQAETPLKLHAFRQAIYLSPRTLGGRTIQSPQGPVALPKVVADPPNLAKELASVTLPSGDQTAITIRLPQPAILVDDRFYNGRGYLLALHSAAGSVDDGQEWSYTLEFAAKRE